MKGVRRRWLRFGRFNLVGLLGAALQTILLWFATKYLHMPGVAATALAVEITLLHNFVWHERFTWRGCGGKSVRQRLLRFWRFHAGNGVISLFGNTVIVYCLVEWLKAPVVPSAMAAIALCSAVNFLLADRWVYAMTRRDHSLI